MNIIDYIGQMPAPNKLLRPVLAARFELRSLDRCFCKGDTVLKGNEQFSGRVVSGALADVVGRNSCQPVITELYLPNELFNLDGIIIQGKRSEIISLSNSLVELVSHDDIQALLCRHPELNAYLWRASLTNTFRQERWLAQITSRSVSERLAYLICDMFTRFGRSGNLHGNSIPMPLLQKQVAMMIGCSDIHANRLIGELRREGLIEWRDGLVSIHNWHQLAHHGGFEFGQPPAMRLARSGRFSDRRSIIHRRQARTGDGA